eukprot:6198430-Pleurochrysis_carterae.AAC.1
MARGAGWYLRGVQHKSPGGGRRDSARRQAARGDSARRPAARGEKRKAPGCVRGMNLYINIALVDFMVRSALIHIRNRSFKFYHA